jgi:hypothetical protein
MRKTINLAVIKIKKAQCIERHFDSNNGHKCREKGLQGSAILDDDGIDASESSDYDTDAIISSDAVNSSDTNIQMPMQKFVVH